MQIKAPYLFDWEHGIALMQCRRFGPPLMVKVKSHGILELRRENGVYSRVTAGMILQSSCVFSEVRNPL